MIASSSRITVSSFLSRPVQVPARRFAFSPRRCLHDTPGKIPRSAVSGRWPLRSTATSPLGHPPQVPSSKLLPTTWGRHYSSSTPLDPSRPVPDASSAEPVQRDVPSYDLTFTCKPCKTRSTHRISKQGYHKGTVLVTCPQCKNRHVISDHLKIFFDKSMTIDKFLEEHGEVVTRGALGPDGDIEIWDQRTDDPTTGQHVGAPWPEGKEPSSGRS